MLKELFETDQSYLKQSLPKKLVEYKSQKKKIDPKEFSNSKTLSFSIFLSAQSLNFKKKNLGLKKLLTVWSKTNNKNDKRIVQENNEIVNEFKKNLNNNNKKNSREAVNNKISHNTILDIYDHNKQIGEIEKKRVLIEQKHLICDNIERKEDSKRHKNVNFNVKTDNRLHLNSICFKRVIVVSNIPKKTGVNGVLSQVCGGPLERVIFYENAIRPRMELYFIFPEHAVKFYNFGRNTGQLIVNGTRLVLEWADRTNTDNLGTHHPLVPRYLLHHIVKNSSRRCLIFAKMVVGKTIKNDRSLHYPNPTKNFSKNLDIRQVRHDFSNFGHITQIGSIISRKLCFSLHFSDIRYAILAKSECEKPGSVMNAKYEGWKIWYGRDITDTPCFPL